MAKNVGTRARQPPRAAPRFTTPPGVPVTTLSPHCSAPPCDGTEEGHVDRSAGRAAPYRPKLILPRWCTVSRAPGPVRRPGLYYWRSLRSRGPGPPQAALLALAPAASDPALV